MLQESTNPSCVDLIITNSCNSFPNTSTISTGLSDFHKMPVTVLKTKFEKAKPKEITYRDYKKFDDEHFKRDLRTSLSNGCHDYREFEEIFLNILQKHAPLKKKLIRENQVSYMTKTLRKAIMRRSQLETKYHKTKTSDDQKTYKKHKNFVSRFYKKEKKKKFYPNLDLKRFLDNKMFWKNIKPLFQIKVLKITIVVGR